MPEYREPPAPGAWEAGLARGVRDATVLTDLTRHPDRLRISGDMPDPLDMGTDGRMSLDDRVKWLNGYAAGIMQVTLPLALGRRMSAGDYLGRKTDLG